MESFCILLLTSAPVCSGGRMHYCHRHHCRQVDANKWWKFLLAPLRLHKAYYHHATYTPSCAFKYVSVSVAHFEPCLLLLLLNLLICFVVIRTSNWHSPFRDVYNLGDEAASSSNLNTNHSVYPLLLLSLLFLLLPNRLCSVYVGKMQLLEYATAY